MANMTPSVLRSHQNNKEKMKAKTRRIKSTGLLGDQALHDLVIAGVVGAIVTQIVNRVLFSDE